MAVEFVRADEAVQIQVNYARTLEQPAGETRESE